MQVVFTIVACSLASGIVFGFAALKPVLIEEGVFHDLCGDEDLHGDGSSCPEQNLKYVIYLLSDGIICIEKFSSTLPG